MTIIAEGEIRQEEESGKGRYVLAMPNGENAELTYVRGVGGHLLIDYTFVPRAYRGRGVAERLVVHAVEEARASDTKLTPLCGYVAAEFRRHPQWAEVLKR